MLTKKWRKIRENISQVLFDILNLFLKEKKIGFSRDYNTNKFVACNNLLDKVKLNNGEEKYLLELNDYQIDKKKNLFNIRYKIKKNIFIDLSIGYFVDFITQYKQYNFLTIKTILTKYNDLIILNDEEKITYFQFHISSMLSLKIQDNIEINVYYNFFPRSSYFRKKYDNIIHYSIIELEKDRIKKNINKFIEICHKIVKDKKFINWILNFLEKYSFIFPKTNMYSFALTRFESMFKNYNKEKIIKNNVDDICDFLKKEINCGYYIVNGNSISRMSIRDAGYEYGGINTRYLRRIRYGWIDIVNINRIQFPLLRHPTLNDYMKEFMEKLNIDLNKLKEKSDQKLILDALQK